MQLILTFHKDISGPLPSDPTDLGQGHPMLHPEEYLMMFDGQTNGNFKFCLSKYGQTSMRGGRSLNRCKETDSIIREIVIGDDFFSPCTVLIVRCSCYLMVD